MEIYAGGGAWERTVPSGLAPESPFVKAGAYHPFSGYQVNSDVPGRPCCSTNFIYLSLWFTNKLTVSLFP